MNFFKPYSGGFGGWLGIWKAMNGSAELSKIKVGSFSNYFTDEKVCSGLIMQFSFGNNYVKDFMKLLIHNKNFANTIKNITMDDIINDNDESSITIKVKDEIIKIDFRYKLITCKGKTFYYLDDFVIKEKEKNKTNSTRVTKEAMEHFMKGKAAHTSYIQLLQFALLLLKPYAMNYEAGCQFIQHIHQSVGEVRSLDELMSQVLTCEDMDVKYWARDVQVCGGNSIFAFEALQLWKKVKAGDKGLESLVNLFSLMKIKQEIVTEAAEAVSDGWIVD